MRIACFSANMRIGQDGVTRVLYRTMEAACERGHDVLAITAMVPEPGETEIPMHRVRSVPLPLQKAYRLPLPGETWFARALSEFQPDLVHIHSPCTLGWSALCWARAHAIPVVATYHTHFPAYSRYYHLSAFEGLAWRITRSFYNGVDRTFVPALPVLEELRHRGIGNLEYLPHGVDLGLFNPAYRSASWRSRFSGGRKPIVLFTSRLVWEKNLQVLADAYTRLREDRDDFEMVIVGDGHARTELEALMPGAHFLGYQGGCALSESYASSDLFVFPSTTETFGLVTLEAMASGLVPVAARRGGAVGIVEDGRCGLLTEPDDADDLARAVSALLDRPAERGVMRQAAISRARRFGWNAVFDGLFRAYDEVCGRSGIPRAA